MSPPVLFRSVLGSPVMPRGRSVNQYLASRYTSPSRSAIPTVVVLPVAVSWNRYVTNRNGGGNDRSGKATGMGVLRSWSAAAR